MRQLRLRGCPSHRSSSARPSWPRWPSSKPRSPRRRPRSSPRTPSSTTGRSTASRAATACCEPTPSSSTPAVWPLSWPCTATASIAMLTARNAPAAASPSDLRAQHRAADRGRSPRVTIGTPGPAWDGSTERARAGADAPTRSPSTRTPPGDFRSVLHLNRQRPNAFTASPEAVARTAAPTTPQESSPRLAYR